MKLLYARGSTDEEIQQQLDAMSDAGFVGDRTMVDRGSEETLPGLLASGMVHSGSVVVASPEHLAPTASAALKITIRLLRYGWMIQVVKPKLTLVANAIDALTFAGALEEKVRDARRVGGSKGGRPSKMTPEAIEAARHDWFGSTKSDQEIASEAGVNPSTIRRMFGKRGH